MHRTKTKNITEEAALLRRFRESRGLSMPEVSELTGKSISWISHIENGRMDVTSEHFRLLLPLYGQTEKSFQTYLTGKAFLNLPSRKECLDTIHNLPDQHIEALLPLVQTLKTSKPVKEDK
jgi:transcriptional regulator with XRE-family HTH domain